MSRHLDNVNRLLVKFRNRYGDKDPVVLQVKTALEFLEVADSVRRKKSMPFGDRRRETAAGQS